MYGDNVFEKDGIRRDRTGDGEKTRCLCGKQGISPGTGPRWGRRLSDNLSEGRRGDRRPFFMPWRALGGPGTAAARRAHINPPRGEKP